MNSKYQSEIIVIRLDSDLVGRAGNLEFHSIVVVIQFIVESE